MSAFLYLGLAQFMIGIALLVFASYTDIKLRKASDIIWVGMGISAVVLTTLLIYFELNDNTIEPVILIGTIPLIGLFCYFLMCEWVVDFESREVNTPWLLLILLSIAAVLVQGYLINIGIMQLLLIIIFFSVFLVMEFAIFYLDYSHFKKSTEDQKEVASIGEKKRIGTVQKEKVKADEERRSLNGMASKVSWVFLFLIAVIFIIDVLNRNGDIIYTVSAGAVIPIVIFILYLKFFDWSLMPGSSQDDPDDDHTGTDIELVPRKRSILERSGWAFLIVFGVLLIINLIYISRLDDAPSFLADGTENSRYYLALFSSLIWLLIFYALYNLGVPKGGADTKALMAITLLFPMYVFFEPLLLNKVFLDMIELVPGIAYIFPFAFSVLINATFITIIIPLTLFLYNASRKDLEFPACFFGYKMDLKQINKKHVWVMDRLDEDGAVFTVLSPGDMDDEQKILRGLRKKGRMSAWVTPKIPFIVPMAIGFVLNFLVGNLLFAIIYGITGI